MVRKNITIDELAVMVQKGFADTATKNDIKILTERLDGMESKMVTKAEMNRRFDELEDRVLASHQKRIEKLEAEVKELRAMFAA